MKAIMITSHSTMRFFLLTVYMFLMPTACSSVCNESVTADQFHQNQSDTIYTIYKKLETILTNDKETLYKLKQAFFSALEPHFWESARVNVVNIRVCVIMDETMVKCNSSGGSNSMSIETQCWKFLWSSSPALTKITSGQLLVFDPVLAAMIYHYLTGSRNRGAHILLHIKSAAFPCIPLERDFTKAVALLLSWVSAGV